MNTFQELQIAFRPVQQSFLRSEGLLRIQEGRVGPKEYACLLREMFHHTRENPQIQALSTVYFRGHQRASIKRFFRHASSEIGHDQLVLDDLRTLGHDVDVLPFQNPLPETSALVAFPFYQIYNRNPVGYLGYLYFLEFLPTGSGGALMSALQRGGVPSEAMSFLNDHCTIDVGHNKLMVSYAEELITNERELNSVIYAMRVTGRLYANMVSAAFLQAQKPQDWGFSAEECEYSESSNRDDDQKTGERPGVGFRPGDASVSGLKRASRAG